VDEGGIELHLQHCIKQISDTFMGSEEEIPPCSQLGIGDDAIVSNHGTKWEHRAKIIQTLDNGISVLVK